MRQGQQNRRGRGRGGSNNNRNKNQNPLTRSFESNGPDIKIRGTPAHVAEKYISLARDALSASDPVLAENYLQHAEHYNRIIMTYREQQTQQNNDTQNGGGRQPNTQHQQPQTAQNAESGDLVAQTAAGNVAGEQPVVADAAGGEANPTPPSASTRGRQQREPRSGGRSRRSRSTNRDNGSDGDTSSPPERRREGENFGAELEQPQFLRRPVRRSRRSAATAGDGDQPAVETIPTDDAGAE